MAAIRDSASVVLHRMREGRRELYWVRRSREVSLGGGFYAFPGGRLDAADAALAPALGCPPLVVTAMRELFEETGVVLGRCAIPQPELDGARKALLDGSKDFARITSELDLGLEPSRLSEAGRWLTPPFMPVRFDARFFLAEMPIDQTAFVWPGELVDGEWLTPEDALARWDCGQALLHPPARHLIECLREAAPPSCLARMTSPSHVVDFVAQRIEFQRGLLLVPVRTPTLPPATHTNCVIAGERELVVIDPASPYDDEQARLAELCRELAGEGRRFREILLTHEHHDHVGGAMHLARELGVPIRAHRFTAERLRGKVRVDAFVEDGERIDVAPISFRAMHVPGHARGHVAFLDERSRSLIAGDMVAGVGTIVVDPPEGDMSDYVASLERLRAADVGAIFPAHGPVIPDGPRKLAEYLTHRQERENQVVRALADAKEATPLALVPRVYADVPEPMHPLAARSLVAVLEKLVREGRASRDGERFRLS